MKLLQTVASGLAPPLCASCGRSCRPEAALCTRCARRLAAADPLADGPPPGVDRAWSSAPHEDVARSLVTALKFRRLLPVATVMADRIRWLAPADLLSGTIVPVPTSPLRTRARGFEPAAELALALAEEAGMPLQICLARRGLGHQRGKRRAQRVGHPPTMRTVGAVPRSVLLVDDVLTTGATLSACARALRASGALRIAAVTFARRL
jgi:predicted amidophosphoribosyltransferase